MPKRNKMVKTPNGIGKIRDIAPLRECVYVKLDEIGLKEFHVSEIEEITVPQEDRKQQRPQQNKNNPRSKGCGRKKTGGNNKRNNNNKNNNSNNNSNSNKQNHSTGNNQQ